MYRNKNMLSTQIIGLLCDCTCMILLITQRAVLRQFMAFSCHCMNFVRQYNKIMARIRPHFGHTSTLRFSFFWSLSLSFVASRLSLDATTTATFRPNVLPRTGWPDFVYGVARLRPDFVYGVARLRPDFVYGVARLRTDFVYSGQT